MQYIEKSSNIAMFYRCIYNIYIITGINYQDINKLKLLKVQIERYTLILDEEGSVVLVCLDVSAAFDRINYAFITFT